MTPQAAVETQEAPPMDRNPYREMSEQEKVEYIEAYGLNAYRDLCIKYAKLGLV